MLAGSGPAPRVLEVEVLLDSARAAGFRVDDAESGDPHPLPPELGRDVQAIALYSSSMYGRVSWFGTFADTLLDQPLKHPPKAASNHAAPS